MSNVPTLIESFMEPCTFLNKTKTPDGMGGFTIEWTDGAEFMAALVKDQSIEARTAEKQGVTDVYTVTVGDNVTLEYHDAFRREADGSTFRVTSDSADSRPPRYASFAFNQFTAERWTLV